MVFQNYALFPHLTVYENIAFPLRMRRAAEATIAPEVRRVLDLVQLPEVVRRLPSELSGGQQQRIALARCMVYRPSIILMDEPLGALDKKLRDQMQLEIKRLHTQLGITVLYVTHDQEEAMIMSDRICLLNDARIEQIGAPEELYFRPHTAFAASFLGDSNLLQADVHGDRGGRLVMRTAAGSEVMAPRGEDSAARGSVLVMVRPESLNLLADDEHADNMIEGRLRDVIMVGGVTKYYVEVSDEVVIAATMLTTQSPDRFARDGRVRVGWSVEDTVVLDTGEASSGTALSA
jgi:putative spermidine/putrescine transport system ATP-binding protein